LRLQGFFQRAILGLRDTIRELETFLWKALLKAVCRSVSQKEIRCDCLLINRERRVNKQAKEPTMMLIEGYPDKN